MKCPNCGSEHLHKKGIRNSKQQYKCVSCKTNFTEGVEYNKIENKNINKESFAATNTNVHCPSCNSTILVKKGFKGNKQRYKCKECGKNFIDNSNSSNREKEVLPKLDKICPHCGGTHIVRRSIENGNQRYDCRTCGKSFSDNTVIRPPVEYPCPYCQGKLIRSGKSKLGQNEYKCTSCGKSCTGDPPKKKIYFYKVNNDVQCPYCNSFNITKRGTVKGIKRYECASCGKSFTEETKDRLEKERTLPKNSEVCPYCGGTRIRSAGQTSVGNSRFRCVSCNKTYTRYDVQSKGVTKKGGTFNKLTSEKIDEIRKLFTTTNLSSADIGKQLEISKTSVSKYCKGLSRPEQKPIKKLVEKKVVEEQRKIINEPISKTIEEQPPIEDIKITKQDIKLLKQYEEERKQLKQTKEEKALEKKELKRYELKYKLEQKQQESWKRQTELKRKEALINSFVKEYEQKLNFPNVPILDSFLQDFKSLSNSFLFNNLDSDLFEYRYTSLLNKSLQQMITLQEQYDNLHKEDINKAICEDVMKGLGEQKVADKYNVSLKQVQDLVAPLYEKETITETQKKLILQYGIGLKVPVDYIAEYVPCSEHMCSVILEKYLACH